MWKLILALLIFSAHLNLTGIVPLLPGDPSPPWWVGGRLLWPFAIETNTLIPQGDLLNTLTPILSVSSAICFILAAAALLRWVVPEKWFRTLIVIAAILSIVLQVIWFTILLWAVFGRQITVVGLRTKE